MCRTQGAKNVEPKDFIPEFTRRRLSSAEIAAGLSGVPGAKVERKKRAKRGGDSAERQGDG